MQQQETFQNEGMEALRRRLEEESARKQRETALAAHQEELNAFDQRIADLAAMIEKNQELAEDEFNINAILIQFLEVTLNLKKVMDMSMAIEKVLSCVSDATHFIDDSMNFSEQIFTQMNAVKYGPFQRIRQKMAMKRAIQNHMERMQSIVARVEGTLQVTNIVSAELARMTARLTKKKKSSKGKKTTPGSSAYPLASQYLSKRKGGEATGTGASTPATPTSTAPAPKTGDDSLSDIL